MHQLSPFVFKSTPERKELIYPVHKENMSLSHHYRLVHHEFLLSFIVIVIASTTWLEWGWWVRPLGKEEEAHKWFYSWWAPLGGLEGLGDLRRQYSRLSICWYFANSNNTLMMRRTGLSSLNSFPSSPPQSSMINTDHRVVQLTTSSQSSWRAQERWDITDCGNVESTL